MDDGTNASALSESVFLVFAKVAPGVIVCQAARRNNSRLRYQPFRPTLLPSPSTSSPSSISPSIVSKLLPDQPINVVEEILWQYFTIIAIKGHFADEEDCPVKWLSTLSSGRKGRQGKDVKTDAAPLREKERHTRKSLRL
uniref:Uncharacterized protein n=1 Tax=Vespula pensylvanica TaxID=30213 RepID=A0A834UCJ3_VESPE|nr:hypothetical protein H0235_004268 [Vespula pensylvanica]